VICRTRPLLNTFESVLNRQNTTTCRFPRSLLQDLRIQFFGGFGLASLVIGVETLSTADFASQGFAHRYLHSSGTAPPLAFGSARRPSPFCTTTCRIEKVNHFNTRGLETQSQSPLRIDGFVSSANRWFRLCEHTGACQFCFTSSLDVLQ
jgi:hypothetical protein